MPDQKLELVSVDQNIAVVRNLATTPLDVALNPELSAEYEYFSVTRGPTQIFTCVRKDGSTWSFEWGEDGATCISESTRRLKNRVVSFLGSEHVFLELRDEPIKLEAWFDRRNHWAIALIDIFGNRQVVETDVKDPKDLNEITAEAARLIGKQVFLAKEPSAFVDAFYRGKILE